MTWHDTPQHATNAIDVGENLMLVLPDYVTGEWRVVWTGLSKG